jgi:tripartite-type tricarboxylate transporter receptor subunit TctC
LSPEFEEGEAMKLPRRSFLHLAAGAGALPIVSRIAQAQTYPMRPVRLIAGYPAGGPTDIGARLAGQILSERLGQQFVIENRPGAASNLGTQFVVRAAPDGYTLLFATTSNAINASLYEDLNFNFIRDIAPVASVYRQPLIMEVHPGVPAKSVEEFIAYAKARPGKINMASGGSGSPQHVVGELFKMMTGVDMLHVPYRGAAPALTDLLGGQVQVMFDTVSSSIELVKAGNLRPLAVTSASRVAALPDVPTVGEFVHGFEASSWGGVGTPKGTSTEIIDKLNAAVNAGLADIRVQSRLAELGLTPAPTSPDEFGKFIAEQIETWAKVVKFSGAKPD